MILRRLGAGLVQRPFAAVTLVWLAVCATLVLASSHIAAQRFPDVDDAMRLLQVRDLLAGQDWYDLHQYRVNPPAGTLMHWSRVVDVPLAGLIWLLSLVLAADRAEFAASFAIPLILLLLTMFTVARIALERAGLRAALIACAAFVLMPVLPAQFQPLRIDHHGWQVLSVALALWAVFLPRPARGAMMAGLAMAVGLIISLETVVMAAGFGLLLTWRWLIDPAARVWLVRYLQALAGGLVVLFALTRGAADLAAHCDAIAPSHLGLFVVIASGVTLTGAANPASRLAVVGGLAASGLGGIALFGWSAPACLGSPFAALDPLVRDLWYLQVREGMPLWQQPLLDALAAALTCLAALGVALFCAIRGAQGERGWWREYALLLAVAILGGFATWRSIAFTGMMATIPLAVLAGWVIDYWRTAAPLPARLAAVIALYLAFLPAAALQPLESLMVRAGANERMQIRPSRCDMYRAAAQLDRLPRGVVFTSLDIGPPVLLETHHSIVASGHHRSQAGMRSVIAAFTGNPQTARKLLVAHRADYVVVCKDLLEITNYRKFGGPGSFASLLTAGREPDWLVPVDLGLPDNLRVWKVVRPPVSEASAGDLLTNP